MSTKTPKWRRIQWIVIPLLLLVAAEGAARFGLANYEEWYDASATRNADIVVIGSSRVASGVNASLISRSLTEQTGNRVKVTNQGRGGSTIAAHYLEVRELIESGSVQNPVVMLELTGGVPAPLMRGTWEEQWNHPEFPSLLARAMTTSDIDAFLDADHDNGDRFAVLSRVAFNWSSYVSFKDGWRDLLFDRGGKATADALEAISPGADSQGSNLSSAGGVATDPAAIERAREAAIQRLENETRTGVVVDYWEQTILASLVELVHENGGQFVFFSMPVSTVFAADFETEIHQRNQAIFADTMKLWGTPLIDFDPGLEDSYFPDLWHLGSEGANVTSEQLADLIAAMIESGELAID